MSHFRSTRRQPARRRYHPAPTSAEILEQRLLLSADVPSFDGSGNNFDNPDWGSTDEELLRLTSVEYADGVSAPAGQDRPSARAVSNAVAAQTDSSANDRYLTDMLWIWGQFLDHDIDLTENAHPAEPFPIEVPAGDPFFDPFGTGTATISLNRSHSVGGDSPGGHRPKGGPRQQINQITAFIDGSVVYGSDYVRAAALRTFTGGRLKTSNGDLLPFNEEGLPNAGGPSSFLFLAGDVRANENVALSAMHTVWVREHNRTADEIAAADPSLTDEEIYQQARARVTAEIQAITWNEFLPALLGAEAIDPYAGYDPTVNPGIANVFSTAAYRLGHSLLSPFLQRLDADGNVVDDGPLPLQRAFFNPGELITNGVDALLRGAADQQARELDTQIVDDVRNFLFGPPGAGGFDLASLNIQRGRDHGLPDYNQARIDLGLTPVTSFAEITSDPEPGGVADALERVYGGVNEIDVWVGGLAEDHLPGSSVGELFTTILVDQFTRLRDGDRFWYQNRFSGSELAQIENTTLAGVIARNTGVSNLQRNVFYAPEVMFVALADYGAEDVTLQVRGASIRLIDNSSRRVIHSRPLAEVEQVMLQGTNGYSDRMVVDGSVMTAGLPGGIVVNAGFAAADRLIVHGTRTDDVITVGAYEVTINGTVIQYSGMEDLVIHALSGHDEITVSEEMTEPVTVFGGPGHDRITGGAGDDLLFGGPGNDTHSGGDGNDVIWTGPGRDTANGGPGLDTIDGREEPEEDDFTDRRHRRRHNRGRHHPPETAQLALLDSAFADILPCALSAV